ncbi:MAG: ABC transporter permease [Bacteroidia bacterium]|nr:ABC transporter permease [Bacteroidia bacterium]
MQALIPVGEFGYLIYRVFGTLRFALRDRERLIYQLNHVGVNSLPLVALIGLFAGGIVAWQAAYQFKGMVSLSVLGGQVVRVMMMEMAPVLTALVMSGRIGASMTAEIGAMKISEQIDALKTMSIDPVRYIVMPRFLSMVIMMPILTFFSIMIAVIGAFLVSSFFLDITYQVFFESVRTFFELGDLVGGLLKGVVFGMLISLIGCFRGMKTLGGARGLGNSTIQAFVISAIAILISDFLLWIILF